MVTRARFLLGGLGLIFGYGWRPRRRGYGGGQYGLGTWGGN